MRISLDSVHHTNISVSAGEVTHFAFLGLGS